MPNIVRLLRKAFVFVGWILSGIMGFAATITLKHLIDTPQPLESALPGEARLYRWHSYHVFYKVLGTPENPPLVLLHNPGIGASAYEMRHIMANLRNATLSMLQTCSASASRIVQILIILLKHIRIYATIFSQR